MSNTNNNNSLPDPSYDESTFIDEPAVKQQQKQDVPPASEKPLAKEASAYTEEIKQLAQNKLFTVEFGEGEKAVKKIYQRRKALMGEVINIENKRQEMYAAKGTPLEIAESIANFYWYSTQVYLRETKTGKPMTKQEFTMTTFEEFKKIIDACEYVMLFGVPNSQSV